MKFQMMPLLAENERQFKQDMQEAFQFGAENTCGKLEREILPERDIDQSLNAEGATAWQAMVDGVMVGGAITVVRKAQGELAFLYAKSSDSLYYVIFTTNRLEQESCPDGFLIGKNIK